MAELNHLILPCRDKARTAAFLVDIFGLPPAQGFGPFLVVEVANSVSLDVMDAPPPVPSQHYVFLVSEAEFDHGFDGIRALGAPYWADPHRGRPGKINRNDGGRGVYFEDPDGLFLELLTRPCGSDDGPPK